MPEISRLAISTTDIVNSLSYLLPNQSGDFIINELLHDQIDVAEASQLNHGLSHRPIIGVGLEVSDQTKTDNVLATSRTKCEPKIQKGQLHVVNKGLQQNNPTADEGASMGGLKCRLEAGEMLCIPEAKRGKDTVLIGVLTGEIPTENSLAELFHVGVFGLMMYGRHKRMIKAGTWRKRALRQKKLLEVVELSASHTAEEVGHPMPPPPP